MTEQNLCLSQKTSALLKSIYLMTSVRSEFYSKLGEDVKTVPQIFIDNKRIGGFQELVRWFGDGN